MTADTDREGASGLSRRQLLTRGAIAGGIVWAAPIIRTTAAYATTVNGTERPCRNFFMVIIDANGVLHPGPGNLHSKDVPPAIKQWFSDNPSVPVDFPSAGARPQLTQASDSGPWAVLLPEVTGPNAAGRQCRMVIGWGARGHDFAEGYVDPNPPLADEAGRRLLFPCPPEDSHGGGGNGGDDGDDANGGDGDDDDTGGNNNGGGDNNGGGNNNGGGDNNGGGNNNGGGDNNGDDGGCTTGHDDGDHDKDDVTCDPNASPTAEGTTGTGTQDATSSASSTSSATSSSAATATPGLGAAATAPAVASRISSDGGSSTGLTSDGSSSPTLSSDGSRSQNGHKKTPCIDSIYLIYCCPQ